MHSVLGHSLDKVAQELLYDGHSRLRSLVAAINNLSERRVL